MPRRLLNAFPQPRHGSGAGYLCLRRSIYCHRLTEKAIHPGVSLTAGSSTRLSTETLSKNHDFLTAAEQGEAVASGEAAVWDAADWAESH